MIVTITDFDGNPKEVIKTFHAAAAAQNPNDTTAGNATSARFQQHLQKIGTAKRFLISWHARSRPSSGPAGRAMRSRQHALPAVIEELPLVVLAPAAEVASPVPPKVIVWPIGYTTPAAVDTALIL